MNVIKKPLSRTQRRAVEHAMRKAEYKKAKLEARIAAIQAPNLPRHLPMDQWTEEQKQALFDSCRRTIQMGIEDGHLPADCPVQTEEEVERAMKKLRAAQVHADSECAPIVENYRVEDNKAENYKGGPKTESGKQISSQNALKHGSCSVSILINPQESMEDFIALEKRWFQSYNPETAVETDLIKAAVRAEWFYLRAERNFAEYDNHLGVCHQCPAAWAEDEHKTYARFLRYRTANQNILNKSRKALEDYRKNRRQEAAKTQATQHAREKLEMAKTKLAIYQENHEPDVPLDQLLDNMRDKAVRLGFRAPETK